MKRLSRLLDFVIAFAGLALVGRLAFFAVGAAAQDVAPAIGLPMPIELLLKMFGGSIVPPLVVFLGGLITKALLLVLDKLGAFFDAHVSKQNAAVLDGGIASAKGIVATIVQSAQNKYVDDLKAQGSNAWTADAQKKIANDVLQASMSQVKASAPQWAAQAGAGLQEMISHMIEEAVANLNRLAPAAKILVFGLFLFGVSCAPQWQAKAVAVTMKAPCPAGSDCGAGATTITVSDTECQSWLSQETAYGALSAGLGVLAGAGGISATFPSTKNDQYLLGGVSLGIGVLSAVSSYLDSRVQDNFGQYCALQPAGK